MKTKAVAMAAALLALTACTPARVIGNAAIDTGQIVLGAADALI